MLKNPLIQRYRYSLLRLRQFGVYVVIYLVVIALLLLINFSLYRYQELFDSPEDLCYSLYYQFVTFQILILLVWGACNSGSAIRDEIVEKTYDFFRLLPVPAHQKAAGILIGRNLVVLLFGVINCLFLLLFGLSGQINAALQGQIFLLLASGMVFTSSMALLSSMNTTKKRKKPTLIGLVLLGFIAAPYLISSIAYVSGKEGIEKVYVGFFNLRIPILILLALLALYFSGWAITGIIRKFNREKEPLFSRKGAFLFMVGFEVILIGIFFSYLREPWNREAVNYYFWFISFVPPLLIALGSLRDFDAYLERSRSTQAQTGPGGNVISRLLVHSNPALEFGLFAIWMVCSIGISVAVGMDLAQCLLSMLVLLSFYIFLLLLMEVYALYKPLSNKTGHLLVFVAVLYIFLPLIFSAILEIEGLRLYSPVGFFLDIEQANDITVQAGIWIVNAFLCIVPLILVGKRYSDILAVRREMRLERT